LHPGLALQVPIEMHSLDGIGEKNAFKACDAFGKVSVLGLNAAVEFR